MNVEQWSFINDNGKTQKVTDRDMVNLASSHILFGWANCVYNFGCGYIHLSQLHNYGVSNPFKMLRPVDRSVIIEYMNQYHNANINDDSTIIDFIPYLPDVMAKVSGHVVYYTNNYILTEKVWDKS